MAAEMERGNPSLPTLTSHPWVSGRLWEAWGEAGELLKAHVLRGALDGRLKGQLGFGEEWLSASRSTKSGVHWQITVPGLSCTDSQRSSLSSATHQDAPCPKAEEVTKTHSSSSSGCDMP